MELNNKIRPYYTKTGENPPLPNTPLNYGVNTKPIKTVWLICILTIIILVSIGFYVFLGLNNIVLSIIVLFLICVTITVWSILHITHKVNVTTTYRSKYLLEVLSPWFKNYYALQLHPDVLSDFVTGTPILANKKTYLTARWDKETNTAYVSEADAEYYSTAKSAVDPKTPRVKLTPTKNMQKNYIQETEGYDVITLDNQQVIVPITKK